MSYKPLKTDVFIGVCINFFMHFYKSMTYDDFLKYAEL